MSPQFQTTRNLEVDVLNSLEEHGFLEITNLEVRVRGDVAFIEGAVPNLKQKKLAGEVVAKVDGICDVVNMLRVKPLSFVDDKNIERYIQRTLTRNPKIKRLDIAVETVDGVVTLRGLVNTVTEKRLTEQEIWAAAGVKDIVNNIEVLSSAPKSDIQIVSNILQSFSECLGIDLSKVSVEINEGIAHLSGSVPTDYLKDAAEELASWTPQVSGVVNDLKVLELPGSRKFAPARLSRSPIEDCSRNIEATDSGVGEHSVR